MTSPTLNARLNTYSPTVVSIFRIIVGLLFALHGAMILFGWPLNMKIPVGDWPAWWAGLIEFVTGVLVLIGLFTRPAAFVASGTMAVAYFWQHWLFNDGPHIFWPFDQRIGGNGGELAIVFCFAFLLILFIGPGSIAIENMMHRRVVSGRAAPLGTRGGFFGRRRAVASTTDAPPRRGGLLERFRRR